MKTRKIPGALTLVARRGKVCYVDVAGKSDLERQTPLASDTIMRIYSMTKPITSVALMTLYEQGLFSLADPVHRYIPSWKNLRVRKSGSYPFFETEPCKRPMTIGDLFMHTSGLTYGFTHATVDGVRGFSIDNPPTARPDLSPSAQMGALSYSRGIVIYGQLVDLITSTVESANLKLRYKSGAEIVVPKETQEVVTVWNQGKDLRILSGEGAGAKWFAVDPDSGAIKGSADELHLTFVTF